MIDPTSVRLALAVVVILAMIHTVMVMGRTSRSPVVVAWAGALAASATSTVLFLWNGTPLQLVTVPLANATGVLCGLLVLQTALALRGAKVAPWVMGVVPAGALLTSMAGDPGHETWAGGSYLLGAMCLAIGAAGVEAWREWFRSGTGGAVVAPAQRGVVLTFAIAASGCGVYYGLRWLVYVVAGPDSALFSTVAGTGLTTLILIGTVTAVTYAATHLAEAGAREELRRRATTDDLTGVLGRAELLERAEAELARRPEARPDAVVVSDLDFFKRVNDTHGHAEGDRALVEFAQAWRAALGPRDLLGRLGGDEFVALLVGSGVEQAVVRADAVTRRFTDALAGQGHDAPTASHGVAPAEAGVAVATLIARADAALYEAKAAGRNTVRVHGAEPEPEPAS